MQMTQQFLYGFVDMNEQYIMDVNFIEILVLFKTMVQLSN